MSTNTNGILLVKSKDEKRKDWLDVFEMLNSPDKVESVDKEYTAISYYNNEDDNNILLEEAAKSLVEEYEVESILLCKIVFDYGVSITLYKNRKEIELWSEDDGVFGNSNMKLSEQTNDLLTTVFSDQYLETMAYESHLKTLHTFSKNYKEKTDSLAKRPIRSETPKFGYGKNYYDETAIIRIKIKDKLNRAKVVEVFSEAIGLKTKDEKNKFQNKFISLFDHEHKIKWCSLYDKYDNYWLNGPQKLLEGLRFVFEEDGCVYFGFDVAESIGAKKGIQYLESVENLIIIFGLIKGVSKLWLKARINEDSTTEMYSIDPVAGYNHPLITEVPITTDSEWPPLDKKKCINQ